MDFERYVPEAPMVVLYTGSTFQIYVKNDSEPLLLFMDYAVDSPLKAIIGTA